MRLIRYREHTGWRLGAVPDGADAAYALPDADVFALVRRAAANGVTAADAARASIREASPIADDWRSLTLGVPIEAPEVWAAGVTYQRSREARNYEATGGKLDASTFYDKVYDAERPEIFFKSTAARTVGPGGEVSLRSDSAWQVPEPELGVVLDGDGRIVAYTIGNDMSCRDIEGENPLYLPQAKMWKQSCSLGPTLRLAETTPDPYALDIELRIYRGGRLVVEERANTGQLKRRLEELVSFLRRDNVIFEGTVLLTGTCIVPPNQFTLEANDRIEIDIAGIGTLINSVVA
ncbi:fumarylacetoacetate hydrolase [Paenibacillus antri]|uniref:Fumarylacetoacetate hydrolase n=1 Tax=Paenibacillus antri TaxID=2582848 RepID=A0A5R9GIJ6_9BACL|nr:fumarylacetoacetate hydrolase family protein [Paenibacillus antri]TLS52653.1 fumarylacetoacetate hydrolase [Paenibacillus antri]